MSRLACALEPLLLPTDQKNAGVPKDLQDGFEPHIVDLYKSILDFQFRSVLRFYRNWQGNLWRDLRLERDAGESS